MPQKKPVDNLDLNIFDAANYCLMLDKATDKVAESRHMAALWRDRKLELIRAEPADDIIEPGRPAKPALVPPRKLPRRSLHTLSGHAALIHSIAHIEFNAINLAWDAVYRFRDMPRQYYDDWVRVADEEAYHFQLVRGHLNSLGYDYGDFDAHNGLWEMAVKTRHDPLVRMALVPRVLEARGLDVTPGIMDRLRTIRDHDAIKVLEIILRDEVGHVEIGSRWFHFLCEQRGLEPQSTFRSLLKEYMKGGKPAGRGQLHRSARLAAGFTKEELDYLEGIG